MDETLSARAKAIYVFASEKGAALLDKDRETISRIILETSSGSKYTQRQLRGGKGQRGGPPLASVEKRGLPVAKAVVPPNECLQTTWRPFRKNARKSLQVCMRERRVAEWAIRGPRPGGGQLASVRPQSKSRCAAARCMPPVVLAENMSCVASFRQSTVDDSAHVVRPYRGRSGTT